MRPYRARINQPSELQPLHHLHGTMCIAVPTYGTTVDLYFTTGSVHSMQADQAWISRVPLSSADAAISSYYTDRAIGGLAALAK